MTFAMLQVMMADTSKKGKRPKKEEILTSTRTLILEGGEKNTKVKVYNDGWILCEALIDNKNHYTVFHINEVNFNHQTVVGRYERKTDLCKYCKEDAMEILKIFGEMKIYDNIESNFYRRQVPLSDYVMNTFTKTHGTYYINNIEKKEAIKTMKKAMEKLTAKQREVIMLCYYEKMTQDEISQKLGIGRTSVESRLNGALKKLRKNF